MDSWLVPPAQMLLGLKLLLTVGCPASFTCRVALAGLMFETFIPLRSLEVNVPAGILFVNVPGFGAVTFTVTIHEPGADPILAGIVPPFSVIVDVPADAVTVPPQVFPVTFTTLNPVGISSLSEALVKANSF